MEMIQKHFVWLTLQIETFLVLNICDLENINKIAMDCKTDSDIKSFEID